MATTRNRSRIFQAILWGGLVAGALDLAFALGFNHWHNGVSIIRVPQAIASGVLGVSSFQGGLTSVALGVVLHFLIALTFAAIYNVAALLLPVLTRRALLCGPLYGATIYFLMNWVVLPLSRAPRFKHTTASTLSDLASHLFLVGLTIALFARRYAPTCSSSAR
jgi:uncharacterized membrane protein YagU involved in acid resistance